MVKRAALAAGLAFVLAGAAAAASCQLVAGLDWSLSDAGTAGSSPGMDASPEAGSGGCIRATYPDPPGGGDDVSSVGPLVFAIHSIDMGDDVVIPGYDLDGVCTCFDDAGVSCVGSSQAPNVYCDQPPSRGVDNQAAKLFSFISLATNGLFGSSSFSTTANAGAWSLLIEVDGYNGMPDDPKVDVSLYASTGLGGKVPAWDGTDVWPVTAQSVGDGGVGDPVFVSNGAYVSGGVLVATMPTMVIRLAGMGSGSMTMRFTAGVVTAQIVPFGASWKLGGGVIAARWAIKDVFLALSSYRDNNGKPFCTDQPVVWSPTHGLICGDADILVDGTQPKSAPCDALSVGLGFTADRALLGGIGDAGAPTPGCPPATDPAAATCP